MSPFPAACPTPGLPLPRTLEAILILAGWNKWKSEELMQM